MPRPFRRIRRTLAGLLLAGVLASCTANPPSNNPFTGTSSPSPSPVSNGVTPTSQGGMPVASVRVTDSSLPVNLDSTLTVPASLPAFGSFLLILSPGALATIMNKLGPVDVKAQEVTLSSLTTPEQAIIRQSTANGASLLVILQLDITATGSSSGIRGFHTRQSTTGQVFLNVKLPDGIRCRQSTTNLDQIVGGTAVTLSSSITADTRTPQTLSGTANAFLNEQHQIYSLDCSIPSVGPPPFLSPSSSPSPSPTPASTPTPTPAPGNSLLVTPSNLSFLAVGDAQTITPNQGSYTGPFTVSPCVAGSKTIATVSPTSGPGPFTVMAVAGGTCTIVVTGQDQQTASVSVQVTTTTLEVS